MPTAIAIRRASQWCLRPFKAAAIPLLRRMVRKLTERFGDEIAPLAEVNRRLEAIEAGQRRLEAFRWDHMALSRRLAALEDYVERLSRHSFDKSIDPTVQPEAVPFAPDDAHCAAGADGGPAAAMEGVGPIRKPPGRRDLRATTAVFG